MGNDESKAVATPNEPESDAAAHDVESDVEGEEVSIEPHVAWVAIDWDCVDWKGLCHDYTRLAAYSNIYSRSLIDLIVKRFEDDFRKRLKRELRALGHVQRR